MLNKKRGQMRTNRREFAITTALNCGLSSVGIAQGSNKPDFMVHYMPWFVARPFSKVWGWHWTMGKCDPDKVVNGRREVAAFDQPIIGPYDSADPDVLEYHLLLMKTAGIAGVIVDWYGRTDFRDYALLHQNTLKLIEVCQKFEMKLAICYEDQTITALVREGRLAKGDRERHALDELNWLARNFFTLGCYYQLDGRPLLLSFGHDGLSVEEWARVLGMLEKPLQYLSQNIRRRGAAGGFDWPSPKSGTAAAERFVMQSQSWPHAIPVIYPRFLDYYAQAGVGESYGRVEDRDGRTFDETMQFALKSQRPVLQIATWNDWGEGTVIEPGLTTGYRDLVKIRALIKNESGAKPEEDPLRLPERLFLARKKSGRENQPIQNKLDQVARWISSGQFQNAQKKLQLLGQTAVSK